MTKNILIIFILIASLFFVSCKGANTENSNSKTENDENLLIGSWGQPNPINEKEVQGFTLNNDGSAKSINMATLVYKQWWTENKKLVLVAESIGNGSSNIDTTIYEIVKNTDKELELKVGDYMDKYTKQ